MHKHKWTALLAALLAMLLINAALAAKVRSPVLGKWQARPDEQTRITYEFNQDGSVFWQYEKDTYWAGARASYRFNDQVQPAQLEIFEFSDPDMTGVVIYGIVAVDDADHLRIAASREQRPETFDASTLVFTRVVDMP